MATVCTTNDFDTDPATGRLRINICGDPAPSEFCDGGENAIHRDEDCGLYVHAARSVEVRSQQTSNVNQLVQLGTAKTQHEDEKNFTVTNPSDCRPATVTVYVNHYVDLNVSANGRVQIGSVTSRNQGQQNVIGFTYNGPDTGEPAEDVKTKIVDAVTFTLPAGQTATLYTSVLVQARNNVATRFQTVLHDAFVVMNVDQL